MICVEKCTDSKSANNFVSIIDVMNRINLGDLILGPIQPVL